MTMARKIIYTVVALIVIYLVLLIYTNSRPARMVESQRAEPSQLVGFSPGLPQSTNALTSVVLDADRIVITNRFPDRDDQYVGYSHILSGSKARDMVRAVSLARGHTPPVIEAITD